MSQILKTAIALSLLFSIAPISSFNAYAKDGDMDQFVNESKNDLLVVVSGGVAGAVLGLSTLSFVEEPKEHTRNILVGASIGIIAGVGYVAFSQASKSRELMYGVENKIQPNPASTTKFETFARVDWHHEKIQERAASLPSLESPLSLGYTFNY